MALAPAPGPALEPRLLPIHQAAVGLVRGRMRGSRTIARLSSPVYPQVRLLLRPLGGIAMGVWVSNGRVGGRAGGRDNPLMGMMDELAPGPSFLIPSPHPPTSRQSALTNLVPVGPVVGGLCQGPGCHAPATIRPPSHYNISHRRALFVGRLVGGRHPLVSRTPIGSRASWEEGPSTRLTATQRAAGWGTCHRLCCHTCLWLYVFVPMYVHNSV